MAERTERGIGDTSGDGFVDAMLAYRGFGLKIPDCAHVTICRTGDGHEAREEGGEDSCEPSKLDWTAQLEPGDDAGSVLDEDAEPDEAATWRPR
jgi:hypothetical protein